MRQTRVLRVAAWLALALAWAPGGMARAEVPYSIVEVPTGQRLIQLLTLGARGCPTSVSFGLAWLDNRRLIYAGFTPVPSPVSRFKSAMQDEGIFIWDVESGEVGRYADEPEFCYADGRIYVQDRVRKGATPNSGSQAYRLGRFGKEQAGVCRFDRGESTGCPGVLNLSLEPRAYTPTPLGPASRRVTELRTGDGVIVANPTYKHRPKDIPYEQMVEMSRRALVLVNDAHPQGKPLPIQEVEDLRHFVGYSEFARRYVLVPGTPRNGQPGLSTNWPDRLPQPVYLMSPAGEVEVVEIANPKSGAEREWISIVGAQVTRAGIVFIGSGRNGGGLFLFDSQRIASIDIGLMRTLAVSPDGCRVAWAIINDYRRGMNDYRIKYMNVCTGAH